MRQMAYITIVSVGVLGALIVGKSLLTPLIFAVIFWMIIRNIRERLQKWRFFSSLPRFVVTILSTVVIFLFLFFFVAVLSQSVRGLMVESDTYAAHVNHLIDSVSNGLEKLGMDIPEFDTEHQKAFLHSLVRKSEFYGALKMVFSSLSSVFSRFLLVLFYVLFLALEESQFDGRLRSMYPNPEQYKTVSAMVSRIAAAVGSYLTLKTAVSLLTGFLSYIALVSFGVHGAALWGFLIFLFNFIPNIGSMIATLFPVIFSLIQFGSLGKPLWLLLVIGVIQMLVGNIVEPKVMGTSLNISPLVVLFSLTFWGLLWGIAGMVLSVPIMVIAMMIMAEFQSTRSIAILLSEKGSVATFQKDR